MFGTVLALYAGMIKRGDIKRYREHLNATHKDSSLWRNGTRGQKTRLYGDYLYHQDREKFMVELEEWVAIHSKERTEA